MNQACRAVAYAGSTRFNSETGGWRTSYCELVEHFVDVLEMSVRRDAVRVDAGAGVVTETGDVSSCESRANVHHQHIVIITHHSSHRVNAHWTRLVLSVYTHENIRRNLSSATQTVRTIIYSRSVTVGTDVDPQQAGIVPKAAAWARRVIMRGKMPRAGVVFWEGSEPPPHHLVVWVAL